MIKAIETVYNGYRFRSRLEARWAVFFDTLGIKYEYEKEGFDLEGTRYLPDFWLPDLHCWIEIKPRVLDFPPQDGVDALKRCYKLMTLTQSKALLIMGEPWPKKYYGVFMWTEEKNPLQGAIFALCRGSVSVPDCREVWLVHPDNEWGVVLNGDPQCTTERYPLDDHARLIAAYTAARQARFEHGEKP